MKREADLSADIENELVRFVRRSPHNSLRDALEAPAWDEPLVGFSRGDDDLYEAIQHDIGPFHWTPLDAFRSAFPQAAEVAATDLTVVSWILPQTAGTKRQQRAEREHPAEAWVRARIYGEELNDLLRKHMVSAITGMGYQTTAPVLLPGFTVHSNTRYGLASTWSERHIAHVCGHGTFGLCDGLITRAGKAVRFGSVVTRAWIEPTLRAYPGFRDYCPFFTDGSCGECIPRCPVGAITEEGHDKTLCSDYIDRLGSGHNKEAYGLGKGGCGLCQTGVACESGIPDRDPERTDLYRASEGQE